MSYEPQPAPLKTDQLPEYTLRELRNLAGGLREIGSLSPYTVTWTGSVSNPAIGNGTLSGRFWSFGKLVGTHIRLLIGSTTTFGSGTWFFTLPFPASPQFRQYGSAYVLDSGTSYYAGLVYAVGSDSRQCSIIVHGAAALVGAAVPIAWATNDELELSLIYSR